MSSTNLPSEPSKTVAFQRPYLRTAFSVLIGLTLFSGVVHGVMDGRWSHSENLVETGARLNQLPDSCGDWELVEKQELDPEVTEMLRCYGSEVRQYRHTSRGTLVTIAVLFGPRGPIAVHRPEICYSSIGTKQIGVRRKKTVYVDSAKQRFWQARFSQDKSKTATLDVWYGWSDGDDWVAAENPRFWMTNNLYKIQIAGPVGNEEFNPCEELLSALLPHINRLID